MRHPWSLAARAEKRAVDLLVGSILLVVSAPVVAVAAIAIKLDSPGPAFFRQERMGWRGRRFKLLKLRGMWTDARARFPDLYEYAGSRSSSEYDAHFPQNDDPRVTRVGHVLRRRSLDELPNLWNVLRGDLSLVGPRPDIPDVAHLYGDALRTILSVRPGVTSPAKALGRGTLTFEEALALDLAYIEGRSLWLDLTTIAKTLTRCARPT